MAHEKYHLVLVMEWSKKSVKRIMEAMRMILNGMEHDTKTIILTKIKELHDI